MHQRYEKELKNENTRNSPSIINTKIDTYFALNGPSRIENKCTLAINLNIADSKKYNAE